MRLRNTLIALVVLLIVGGYAFVMRFYSKPIATTKTVLKLKPKQIARVDLKYPDRELVIERKPGGPWMIVKPIAVQADQTTANNLARAIADCKITKTVERNPTDLVPFGLAKPRVTVTVTTTANKTLAGIEVGRTTPVGYSTYIKRSDRPAVMLTSSAFQAGMEKTVNDMRDRGLMAFKVDDVDKLTISHAGAPAIELDNQNGAWKIVKPVSYPADASRVQQVLSALENLRVADFVSDHPTDVARYGLEKPHFTITVDTSGKKGTERQSLLFGSKQNGGGEEGVYVQRAGLPPVYTVHSWELSSLDKSILDLRDKTVLAIDPAKVARVEIDSNAKQVTLKRVAKGNWDFVADGKTSSADAAAIDIFLDRIRHLKGNSIVMDPMKDPQAFGMDKPALIFKFADKDGKPLGEIRFSKTKVETTASEPSSGAPATTTQYYITSSASTALFSTDQFMFSQMNKSADHFRPRGQPTASPSPALPAT
jgi:Domain of unknown function (DUF4340)